MLKDNFSFICELEELIKDRKKKMPKNSYTTRLFEKGVDKILQKVGEESVEFIIDAKNHYQKNNKKSYSRAVSEAADLIYHLTVTFIETGISWNDVANELKSRHGKNNEANQKK